MTPREQLEEANKHPIFFVPITTCKETKITPVFQGSHPETSGACAGLSTLMILKRFEDPSFNPFTTSRDRKKAKALQDSIRYWHEDSHYLYLLHPDHPPKSGLELDVRIAGQLISDEGYKVEPEPITTTDLSQKKLLLESMAKKTQNDGHSRALMMAQLLIPPSNTRPGSSHMMAFGVRRNEKGSLDSYGLDSNADIFEGTNSQSCHDVIDNLIKLTDLYHKAWNVGTESSNVEIEKTTPNLTFRG